MTKWQPIFWTAVRCAHGVAECHLGAQMTGAPPPEEATTLQRSPPGCT